MIEVILDGFKYTNTVAAYFSCAVLILFIIKHPRHRMNSMLIIFTISSAFIAVLYTLILLGCYSSAELIPYYRVAWTPVLVAPAAFVLANWYTK